MKEIEVLVIDQAPSVRTIFRRIISDAEGMTVLGEAETTEKGKQLIDALNPDVVVIGSSVKNSADISELVRRIQGISLPVVILTAPLDVVSGQDHRGRIVSIPKPAIPEGWEALFHQIPALIRNLVRGTEGPAEMPFRETNPKRRFRFVAIGASAGGPSAVCKTLKASGPALQRVGVAIVQHIGTGFESGFVDWLTREFPLQNVSLACHGEVLSSGRIRVAPPETHLEIDPQGAIRLDRTSPPMDGHRPSVTKLLLSLAGTHAEETIGLLLSGMGEDGVEGLLALRKGGGLTLVQESESCVVDGMPKAALAVKAAAIALPPEGLGLFVRQAILDVDR
ncbi:MAG: chemotaxis protein CheB [Thermoanaerobaculales bacterium]|nr:chemotaxis protein CheB [Thermoanaerobaculales bacterium]